MRIDFTSLVTGAIIFGASATFAVAQQQPTPFPWEKTRTGFSGGRRRRSSIRSTSALKTG